METTTDEKKREIKKEYAKLIYEDQKTILPLIEELNKNIDYEIKIKDEEINIQNYKNKKDKKDKKDKTKKKSKKDEDKNEEDKNKDEPIKYFSKGYNKWLSAFNIGNEFEYDGYIYPTVEHAFHAQKIDIEDSKIDEYKKKFTNKDLIPSEAKKMGGKKSFQENNYKFREDWDKIKLDLMKEIYEEYYKANPKLLEKLKETGNRELLHTGPRIDTYWGVNSKGGNNHHGKILMKIRDE